MTGWLFYLSLGTSLEVTILLRVTNFSESTTGPAIFFYLNAGYWDSLVSLSPLLHIPNMLTCFGSFLSSPSSLLTKEKGAKNADVSGPWLGSACTGGFSIKGTDTESACIAGTWARRACIWGTCIWDAYFVGGTYMHTKDVCIADPCTGDVWIKNAYISSSSVTYAYIKNASTKSACIGSACIKTFCAKDRNLISWDGCVCGSAHKPSKSSIWCSRLLVESISDIPVSSYLHLWIILEKLS